MVIGGGIVGRHASTGLQLAHHALHHAVTGQGHCRGDFICKHLVKFFQELVDPGDDRFQVEIKLEQIAQGLRIEGELRLEEMMETGSDHENIVDIVTPLTNSIFAIIN